MFDINISSALLRFMWVMFFPFLLMDCASTIQRECSGYEMEKVVNINDTLYTIFCRDGKWVNVRFVTNKEGKFVEEELK